MPTANTKQSAPFLPPNAALMTTSLVAPALDGALDATEPQTAFDDSPLVVTLPDMLTVQTRTALKHRIIDEIEVHRRRVIVLDATGCSYIDGSGLGVIVSIAKRAKDAGGSVSIGGLNEEMRTVFELTKLDTVVAVLPHEWTRG